MNSLILGRCTLSVCAAAALLAGCGGLQPAVVTQGPTAQGRPPEDPSRATGVKRPLKAVPHSSVTESVLHSFGLISGGSGGLYDDGFTPKAGLTYSNGMLFGTTVEGGCSEQPGNCAGINKCPAFGGCGIVYRISPSGGTYTILHSFIGGKDGYSPDGDMILLNGTLYGTTSWGGGCAQQALHGCGVVFSITPSGYETIRHAFAGSPDGYWPEARLRNVNGTMYGTTLEGGVGIHGGLGTAFTITPSGNEHVIHTFREAKGALPGHGALVDLNGTLYGTTTDGGEYGEGAVFSLSTSGSEKLLHSFNDQGSSKDGAYPVGGLIAVKQTLYGTTERGGAYNNGTVFSITPSGTETVLHSFNGSDGAYPEATLLNVNGTLYGTTVFGGAYGCVSYAIACGTVFSITPSGHETVLHSFGGYPDGSEPYSDLIDVNGTLYGTTAGGGDLGVGDGTVFSITL
jgi:uncharacterized repeat protein (TIGR03803 family)